MKKSLLALAVFGAFASVAQAQSTVTLFGVVDLSANSITNGSGKAFRDQKPDQYNSNRLGFRGVEDLGGGLRAGFWLEAGLAPDVGGTGGSNGIATVFFNRRSTLSLMGNFGEIRLGRDYNPSFWNTVIFDAVGGNGLGQSLNFAGSVVGSGAATLARSNNSFGYFLPGNLGGFYGQAQYAPAEGVAGQAYRGIRLGFAAGPVDVAFGTGSTKTATSDNFKITNIGGSYDLGVAKILGFYNKSTHGARSLKTTSLSVAVPMGQAEFKAGWLRGDQSGPTQNADDATQLFAQGLYHLSKRTSLYTTFSRISNKGKGNFALGGGSSASAAELAAGGWKSTGYNVGVRHVF